MKKNSNSFTFFDLCAGIGTAHFAFKNIGIQCIGYSEIDSRAQLSYQFFHSEKYQNYGDLMKINLNNLPLFDILVAGFPCQSFSIVGKRTGFDDERGKIIYGLSKIIEKSQPKAFLLENVKGLENINQGKDLKEIINILKQSNYQVCYKILQSLNYGTPQSRERIYIVGIRNDLYKKDFVFPPPYSTEANLKDFLIEKDDSFILNIHTTYQTFLKYLQNKYNKDKFFIDDLLNQDYLVLDTRQSDLRLYHNKTPTLRRGRQGILYVKNKQIRKLSAMEALLLQGFEFEVAKKAQANFSQGILLSQAGNAMTINVMQEIGKSIIEYLL